MARNKRFQLGGKVDELREQASGQVKKEDRGNPNDITKLSIDSLKAAPWNTRKFFDQKELQKLAYDLQKNGQIQPLVVRPSHESFEIVVGERRYRAAKLAGINEVKVDIRNLTDNEAQFLSLSENLQRQDLNVFEEVLGYLQLLLLLLENEEAFLSFKEKSEEEIDTVARMLKRYNNELSSRIPREKHIIKGSVLEERINEVLNSQSSPSPQSFTNNKLPILDLPEDILNVLKTGKVEYTKAKVIANLKDSVQRQSLLSDTLEHSLTLSQIKAKIKNLKKVPEEKTDFGPRLRNVQRALKKITSEQESRVSEILKELELLLGLEK